MSNKVSIDDFLKVMADTPLGGNEEFPLSGIQISLYFDVFQATDIYEKINHLLKEGKSNNEIGKLFDRPTKLRYYLAQNGIVGLKVADIFKIKKITVDERTRYTQTLLDSLATMVKSDPLCRDSKNIIWDSGFVEEIAKKQKFFDVNNENRRSLLSLGVDLYTFAWTAFYNAFVDVGYEIHGPYAVKLDGIDYQMIVKENLIMNPSEIWGDKISNKYSQIRTYLLYNKGFEYKINYYNQPTSESHSEYLEKISFEVNGKSIGRIDEVKDLSKELEENYTSLTKFIKSLPDIDKVKYGAKISFLKLQRFYDLFNEKIEPEKIVEDTYKKFGEKLIEENKGGVTEMEKTFAKLYDPRIDTLS